MSEPHIDVVAGLEMFAVDKGPPEVEISRRFDDPAWRIKAMYDFAYMTSFFGNLGYNVVLAACWVENDNIVWRFKTPNRRVAEAFNALFDQDAS